MSAAPVFLSHPSSLDHQTGGHPENVGRIKAITAELERHDYFGWERVSSPVVQRSVLEQVHPAGYIDAIAKLAKDGGGQIDADTLVSSGSYVAALHAAGGAVELVRRLLDPDGPQTGFSAHRPPGHHAIATRAMGFCLFNNIAVAARYATDVLGLRRVLILDWDVHHGNGTSDIFWEDGRVLLASIHEWPLYPGSGRASEVGRGAGRGHTANLPVPSASGDSVFVSLVRDVVVPLARAFGPELILVSAGYDAHRDDPLATCTVTDGGFAAMTTLVRDLSGQLEIPLGLVLEGGYDPDALARCVAATMQTLSADGGPPRPPSATHALNCETHPLAVEALARLSEFWPTLGAV